MSRPMTREEAVVEAPVTTVTVSDWTAPLRLESFHRDLREGRPAVFVVD